MHMVSVHKILYLAPIALAISDDIIDVYVTITLHLEPVWIALAIIFFALWAISKVIVKGYGEDTIDDFFRSLTETNGLRIWRIQYLYLSGIVDIVYAIISMRLTKMIQTDEFSAMMPTLLISDFVLAGIFAISYIFIARSTVRQNKRKDRSVKIAYAVDQFKETYSTTKVRDRMINDLNEGMTLNELGKIRDNLGKLISWLSLKSRNLAEHDKIVLGIMVVITIIIFWII
jgi:hypothetical protein